MSSETPDSTSFLERIRSKTKINPFIVLLGLAAALTAVFYGHFQERICLFVGTLFPIYMSVIAIESPDKEDDKHWCTYWVVFFSFTFVENYANLALELIPFYFLIKLAFLIWLFLPATNGANLIYNYLLVHFWSKYESNIDSVIDKGTEMYDNVKDKVKKKMN